MKTIFISCIFALMTIVGSTFPQLNKVATGENMNFIVSNKEDAISIGEPILRDKYTVSNKSIFDAQDNGKTWKVYSYVPPLENPDGSITVVAGGSVYAIINKENGQIQSIGVDD